jgi:phosphoribosylaminoimidazole-succinocarboxamide synthase
MSVFFFDYLSRAAEAPNHLAGPPDDERIPADVLGRALVVEELEMMPVECVARGYLTGSGLVEYEQSGTANGVPLPPGLVDGSRLDRPIFTPAMKAEVGAHDENVSFEEMAERIADPELAAQLKDLTLAVYARARDIAEQRGIILADTKFEFGRLRGGTLVLADEVLTPDSSRFWPADAWKPGRSQPSFDKQYVRDWLSSPASGWDRRSDTPPPALPEEVVQATRDRYVEAYERLTGEKFV